MNNIHLVYTHYQNEMSFKINSKNQKIDEVNYEMEEVLNKYKNNEYGSKNMDLYIKLRKQEMDISKQAKEILVNLKLDFKDNFLKELEDISPELFI